MLSDTRYANLGQLIVAYFGEDSDLSGSNVAEIVACYKRESSQATCESVLREIDMFVRDNRLELDAGLTREFGNQFDPRLWGYTVDGFLDELARLLRVP